MIVTQKTQDAVEQLIGQAFFMNRKIDRMVSVLGVKFAFNQTSSLIHLNIAHYFPLVADVLGEKCLERYNIPVYYPATPEGNEDYQLPSEIIHRLEELLLEYQTMLMGACKVAMDNNDIHVYADLLEVLKEFNMYVEQGILLVDKIDAYGNVKAFDHDIDKFWILGEK